MTKEKRYTVKPKSHPDKFWNPYFKRWNSSKNFDIDQHTTNDRRFAAGRMSEDAARRNPDNTEADTPVQVDVVEVDRAQKGRT